MNERLFPGPYATCLKQGRLEDGPLTRVSGSQSGQLGRIFKRQTKDLMENIEDENFSRILPSFRKGEEIPIEEFEGAPDWNAAVWKLIQARDAQALKVQSLAADLALKPTQMLEAALKVCIYEQQDEELQELIRAELKRRPDTADPAVA